MEPFVNVTFSRPIIVVSKCLGFAHCRYDGEIVPSPLIDRMRPYIDLIDVCPECEIGLGVPREPIIIVDDGRKRLIQPATGLDLTEKMKTFSRTFLEELDDFDGFILKSSSPSCGVGTTRVFQKPDSTDHLHREGTGFFADAILDNYPELPLIDEKNIKDPFRRHHFLTGIFALASFRDASLSGKMHSLVEYHTRNKLLFMAYNKEIMNSMGKIVANRDSLPVVEVYEKYLALLSDVLSEPAGTPSTVNALFHAYGYLSRYLTPDEKFRFMQRIQEYRDDNTLLMGLNRWFISRVLEFNIGYLSGQTLFCPYPCELQPWPQIV